MPISQQKNNTVSLSLFCSTYQPPASARAASYASATLGSSNPFRDIFPLYIACTWQRKPNSSIRGGCGREKRISKTKKKPLDAEKLWLYPWAAAARTPPEGP